MRRTPPRRSSGEATGARGLAHAGRVVKVLRRKLWRDMGARRAQFLAVVVTIGLFAISEVLLELERTGQDRTTWPLLIVEHGRDAGLTGEFVEPRLPVFSGLFVHAHHGVQSADERHAFRKADVF